MTTPVLELSKEEDNATYMNYAADLAEAQSTWDPWQASKQDTLQPAQDTLSSPHGDPSATPQDPWEDLDFIFLSLKHFIIIFCV